ncbi:MAG: hypothetical protein N3D10_04360 [Candidatus Micrarchaeota archaeon]|nr:hypothetical protein [Candidatus Micrarchaeota archaeon]
MNKKVVFLTVALVAAYNNYNLMPNFTNKQVLAEEQRIVSQSSLINEKIKKIDKKLAPEKKNRDAIQYLCC